MYFGGKSYSDIILKKEGQDMAIRTRNAASYGVTVIRVCIETLNYLQSKEVHSSYVRTFFAHSKNFHILNSTGEC